MYDAKKRSDLPSPNQYLHRFKTMGTEGQSYTLSPRTRIIDGKRMHVFLFVQSRQKSQKSMICQDQGNTACNCSLATLESTQFPRLRTQKQPSGRQESVLQLRRLCRCPTTAPTTQVTQIQLTLPSSFFLHARHCLQNVSRRSQTI